MYPIRDMDDLQPSVKTPRLSSKRISNAFKTVWLPTSGSVLISGLLERVANDCGWIDEALENKRTCTCWGLNPNKPHFKILFLCTGNSARSIFAEYLLKEIAPVRFETYSAGASPKPAPHPLALEILRQDFKIDASDAYSKSWEEFKDAQFDFVITLCDNAKGLPCLARAADCRTLEFSRSSRSGRFGSGKAASLLAGSPTNKTPP